MLTGIEVSWKGMIAKHSGIYNNTVPTNLACDHALSLYLCNLFSLFFFPLEPKKQGSEIKIAPDLRLQLISYLRSPFPLAVGDLGTRLSANLNPVNLTTVHNNAIFQKKQ